MLNPRGLAGERRGERLGERLAAWPIMGLLLLAVGLYLPLTTWHSLDADHWFVPWLDQMVGHGAWRALGQPMQVETDGASGFANYNPPYLYLLALASMLSPLLGSLAIVKLVAAVGTLLCAGCVFGLVRQFVPMRRAGLAAAALLLLPTVALNGAGWGQTDAIYTGLLVLTVAASVAGRWGWMMAAFGAALAFKLPAVFLAPFVLYVMVSHRVSPLVLLWAALSYLAMLVPALLAGQPWRAVAGVYLDQAETYHWLSMKAPNPWAFIQYFGVLSYGEGVLIGAVCTAASGLAVVGLALRWRLAGTDLVLLAASCAILMPFLLPKMHDRYFFPADILSFAYAVIAPSRPAVAMAAAVQAGSLAAYSSILFGVRAGPFLGAVMMAVAVALAGLQLCTLLGLRRKVFVAPL